MKRLLSIFAFSALMATISPLATAQTKVPVVADEVAAVVGNNTILLSDIERNAQYLIEQRKEKGTLSKQTPYEEALETLIIQNLLSQRARRDSLDKQMNPVDDKVEEQMRRMINQAGGPKELERKTGKPIFQIRSDLSRQIQDTELGMMMEQKIREQTKITYDEVKKFAESIPADSMQMIPPQFSFSKIVKIPPQTDERKYAIRERLLEYRRRIMEGEKFSVLARLYSMDGAASNGGEAEPTPSRFLVAPFMDAIEELKPGQVSGIVETEFGLHIIELISYKDGIVHYKHIILSPEFTIEESRKVEAELDSLASEIKSGRLDFKTAAQRYSDDVSTRENGGKSFNTMPYFQTYDLKQASTRYMQDELNPEDYKQLRFLKVGEISPPYETINEKGNLVKQVIKLDELIPGHKANLQDDYSILEMYALYSKQAKEASVWIDKAIKEMFIEIMPEFSNYKFERAALESKKKK